MRIDIYPKILSYMSFFMAASAIMTPLWGHYIQHIHGDIRLAGIAIGSFSLAYGISSPIMAVFIKKIDQVRLSIPVSYFLFGTFSIGYFFVDSPTELCVLQVLLGFSYSIQASAYDALFGLLLKKGKETLLWGSYSLIYGIAIAFGALMGSHLAHYTSYDIVFGVIIGFSFFAFVLALFIKHPKVSLYSE